MSEWKEYIKEYNQSFSKHFFSPLFLQVPNGVIFYITERRIIVRQFKRCSIYSKYSDTMTFFYRIFSSQRKYS